MTGESRLSEQELKYLRKAVPLLDRVIPLLDRAGTWLAQERALLEPATGATSELTRLEDEARHLLKEWQRLKPPKRFRQPWQLYQVVLSDLGEMVQSTQEALRKQDVSLIAGELEVFLARYRADLQRALHAHDQLRQNLLQGLRGV